MEILIFILLYVFASIICFIYAIYDAIELYKDDYIHSDCIPNKISISTLIEYLDGWIITLCLIPFINFIFSLILIIIWIYRILCRVIVNKIGDIEINI